MLRAERIAMPWPTRGLTSIAAIIALVVAAAVGVSAPPLSVSVAIFVGATAVVLTLVNPILGLGVLILSIPFSSLGELAMGGFDVTSTEFVVALLLFAWLGKRVRERERQVSIGPLAIPITLFIGLIFLSSTTGSSLPLSLKELVKWLELLVVYLFVINNVTSQRQIKAILVVLFVAALAQAFIGYFQFFSQVGPDSFKLGGFMRAYGTFGQPNPYAGYLTSVAVLALSLGLVPLVKGWSQNAGGDLSIRPGGGRWPGIRKVQPTRCLGLPRWLILFSLASFGLIFVAIVMSLSRGAWLGLTGGAIVIGLVCSRKTQIALIVLGLLLALVLLFGLFNLLPAELAERTSKTFEYFGIFDASLVQPGPENWAMVERMANWQAAWAMYERSPWFGVGVGNYAIAYPDFALKLWQDPQGHAHNVYLNTLSEMGTIGLGAYLLLLGSFFVYAASAVRRTSAAIADQAKILSAALAIGMLSLLTALSIHNLFDSLFVHGMSAQIGLMLGLISEVHRNRR